LSSAQGHKNLSEVTLSRITTIFVTEYSVPESQIALESMINRISVFTHEEPAVLLCEVCKQYKIGHKRDFSFTVLSKILNLYGRFYEIRSGDPAFYLGLSVYRILCRSYKTRDKKLKLAETLGRAKVLAPLTLLKFLQDHTSTENQPFDDSENDFRGIRSKLTLLHIPSRFVTVSTLKVAFVRQFVEMVDVVHTGIALHYPVILQGGSG